MDEILLYLWFADVTQGLTPVLSIFGSMGFVIWIFILIIHSNNNQKLPKIYHCIPIGAAILILIAAILPSKQFFYIAAGGSATMQAFDSEIGKKVQVLVNQKLDELINMEGKTK